MPPRTVTSITRRPLFLPGSIASVTTVSRFNITPVKSTALLHPERIDLTDRRVVGDRTFIFLDADRRRSGSVKAPLLTIDSHHEADADVLTLALPGGTTVEGDATPIGEPFPVALYDRTIDVRLVDGSFADEVSRWAGFPLMLARAEVPEYAGGIHPVSLISLATVDDLGRRGGVDEMPDPRRFRMTIELDGCDAYEEDTWSGRRLRIGGAELRVGQPVSRCVLTTLDPDTGDKDFPTLEVLATYRRRGNELVLGLYSDVVRPGRIGLGDRVQILGD
jgi:uncharacterized protein